MPTTSDTMYIASCPKISPGRRMNDPYFSHSNSNLFCYYQEGKGRKNSVGKRYFRMFSNSSLNTNFQAYVERTEKPTEELFSSMSQGIYMEPETPAFLVNVQTLQRTATLLSKPTVLGKLPPYELGTSWCWWSKPLQW